MEEVFLSKNAEETQEFAQKFAEKIASGGVMLLYGDLGAGKTTFVQGLAKGLGIQKRIISPTFVIVRQYGISNVKYQIANSKFFYHVDLYRLQTEKEIEGLGLTELMKNLDNVVVIEWPERLGSLTPSKRWELKFKVISDNEREISVNDYSSSE